MHSLHLTCGVVMHLLSLSVSVNLSQNIAKCSFSLACDWCLMLTPSSGVLIHCCLSVTDTFICRINLFNRIAPGSWQQILSKGWPQCPASSDLRTGSINSIYQTPVDTIPAFHKFCAVPTVRRGAPALQVLFSIAPTDCGPSQFLSRALNNGRPAAL